MGILEKLRPVPRWKHADPAVRAAAVYDLGGDELESLRALAREDADPRVRRAAVARLDDIALLGEVAQTDPDEDVRVDAIRHLAGLGAETAEVSCALEVVRHLVGMHRLKEVGLIVRENREPAIRAAVVDVLDDQRALGSISRHAPDGGTRLRALARVSEPEEIAAVAAKSEHTDSAVAALERILDVEALTVVAQRARNKVASRRARTRVRQIEDAARPVVDVPVPMPPADRARAIELLQRTEALVALADAEVAGRDLSAIRLAWAELQADVEVEAGLLDQFGIASDAVREAIAERLREREVEQARMEALAREQADRLAIVQEIEQLAGADSQDRIAELKVQWDVLPPIPSEYAASLTRRFQDACRAYADRERRRTLAEAAVGRIETLATELEQLLASDQPVNEVVARWRGLRRDADVLREHAEANPAAAARLEAAVAVLEGKEQDHQVERTRHEQEHLRRLQQLARQIEVLAAAPDITLKAGDRALRDIRQAMDDRTPLATKQERQEIHARLEQARTAIAPRVQELRDADEWQRWANLQVQEDLCREMEALKEHPDAEHASRRMRELQGRWKQVALAPRAQGEAMWRRFKTAQDAVFARTSGALSEQHEQRAASLERKQAICARAECLAESSDWVKTAAEVQQLQAEWKTLGPVPRGHEKAIWERFRGACDRFFTRRQEDLKHRKEEWATNLSRKEALCVHVEALAESTDWEPAAAQVKQAQAEWKTIGPVRKTKSDAVWERFRGACDHFFDRYKHRDRIALQEKAGARDEVIHELEALLPSADGEAGNAPEDLYARVQQARTRWQQGPDLPRGLQQDLAARYHDAIGRLLMSWPAAFAGTDLDPEAARERMEKLIGRVEALVSTQPAAPVAAALSPTERLAQQWRERLAANTITGGRGAEQEDSRWRTAEQDVRNLQSQWSRLGPVPAVLAGPLNERFQRAVRTFYDQRRKAN